MLSFEDIEPFMVDLPSLPCWPSADENGVPSQETLHSIYDRLAGECPLNQ